MRVMAETGKFKQLAKTNKPPCFQSKLGSFPATSSRATSLFAVALIHDLLENLLRATQKLQASLLPAIGQPQEQANVIRYPTHQNDNCGTTFNGSVGEHADVLACKAVASRTASLKELMQKSEQLMTEAGAFG
jgi:hypothetical protein